MAAEASPNKKVSLKALENEAKENSRFYTSNDATLDNVMKLFWTPMVRSKRNPIFLFVIGSPGVGKSTQTQRFLNEQFKYNIYETMFNVSLDTIVENIQPYRNATLKTYRNLESKNGPITNDDYDNFSKMYLQIIQSKQKNFSVANQTQKLRERLHLGNANANASIAKTSAKTSMAKASMLNASIVKIQVKEINENGRKKYVCPKCLKKFLTKATPEKHIAKGCSTKSTTKNSKMNSQNGGSLMHLLDEAIIEGIKRSYNILYDTTFDGLKKFEKVLQYIKDNQNTKYDIIVLHITATPATIYNRIQHRHQEMIKQGFLRAINLKMISKFVVQNQKSYDAAKEKYEEHGIRFFEIENELELHPKSKVPQSSRSRSRTPKSRRPE